VGLWACGLMGPWAYGTEIGRIEGSSAEGGENRVQSSTPPADKPIKVDPTGDFF